MNTIGLYLHIPFCDGKCAYCSFFSRCATEATINEYTSHLINAVKKWGAALPRPVDTVYFGGGTPSLIGHERLVEILHTVKSAFAVSKDAEITVEVNPSSTAELDFAALRQAGFNRLSIGMQSADDHELKALGRRHDLEAVKRTVSRAQEAGFDNISLDVMLAIPGQTEDSLDRTLRFCADCGVQHISSYILKIEEGTRFYTQRDMLPLFSEDEQAALYEYAVRTLADLGYKQYEISNFSKEGYESRHNLHYWHDEEYLGIGPSAHSFLNGKRFYYDSDFEHFYNGETVYESGGGDKEEYIMLALRLSEGLIFRKYAERFREELPERMRHAARRLECEGLCTVSGEAIALTVKGFLVSNAVIAYLLENT